jgi:hypothetical protein
MARVVNVMTNHNEDRTGSKQNTRSIYSRINVTYMGFIPATSNSSVKVV